MFELIAYDLQSHKSEVVSQSKSVSTLKDYTQVRRWTPHYDGDGVIHELTGLCKGSIIYTIRHNPFAGIRFYASV